MNKSETLTLDIITPNGLLLSKDIVNCEYTSPTGSIGILPNHSPTVTTITSGKLRYDSPTGEHRHCFLPSGFVHITPEKVSLLVPFADTDDTIDIERAKRAEKRALDRLKFNEKTLDKKRAEASLFRAETRIAIHHLLFNETLAK